ncbi:MAG TPA: hypothetical protein VFP36_05480 [Usitatibacter sp.]|nr:hypothetical protein [Usitatibacter sp.]
MRPLWRSRGAALWLALFVVMLVMLGAFQLRAGSVSLMRERDRTSERVLAYAREALLAYAADHPVNASVGPGYLPCPDLDNDGWAEPTCGSLSGDSGQEQRLGRLPWKTLGLADLRDGHGERLWYAVSSKYKGLLNCAASRGCVDMSPAAALGTITVRDASGLVLQDGTVRDAAHAAGGGAVAVVIAPGAPLERTAHGPRAALSQRRDCSLAECDPVGRCVTDPPQRAPPCDPANYLDAAGGIEDNADFVDRNDAAGRPLDGNGFIQGPVVRDGRVVVNDRIAVITYGDLMPRIMRRVALEVASCLRSYASRPENRGRYPWTGAACADTSHPVADIAGGTEGRLADTPFVASSVHGMLPQWWRTAAKVPEQWSELPTRDDACRIAIAPDDAGPARTVAPPAPHDEGLTPDATSVSWWNAWKPYVTFAMGTGYTPDTALPGAGCDANGCMDVVDAQGRTVAAGRSAVVVVHRDAAACAAPMRQCDASGCRVRVGEADAFAALPP